MEGETLSNIKKNIVYGNHVTKNDYICVIPYSKGNAFIRDEDGFPCKLCGLPPDNHKRTHIGKYKKISYIEWESNNNNKK